MEQEGVNKRTISSAIPLTGILLSLGAFPALAGSGPSTGCADISSIAPFTQFSFNDFQTIFETLADPKNPDSQVCTSCHQGQSGPAQLGLGAGFSYDNLVGVPSTQVPTLLRVNPGNPMSSWLFQKINCEDPEGEGVTQMPQGFPPLTLPQQAFFYDWIRLGAPLSRLGFEDR